MYWTTGKCTKEVTRTAVYENLAIITQRRTHCQEESFFSLLSGGVGRALVRIPNTINIIQNRFLFDADGMDHLGPPPPSSVTPLVAVVIETIKLMNNNERE